MARAYATASGITVQTSQVRLRRSQQSALPCPDSPVPCSGRSRPFAVLLLLPLLLLVAAFLMGTPALLLLLLAGDVA